MVPADTVTGKTYDLCFNKRKLKEEERAKKVAELVSDIKHEINFLDSQKTNHALNAVKLKRKREKLRQKKLDFFSKMKEASRQEKLQKLAIIANTSVPKELECVVCRNEVRTHCFAVCGHFAVCGICVGNLDRCPICNRASMKKRRVYLS